MAPAARHPAQRRTRRREQRTRRHGAPGAEEGGGKEERGGGGGAGGRPAMEPAGERERKREARLMIPYWREQLLVFLQTLEGWDI